MRSINEAFLQGNLTRDPITRKLNNDQIVVVFGLATSEKVKTADGVKEYKEFHEIAIFNQGMAKAAAEYLRKGSAMSLRGKIERREYTDGQNVQKRVTQIAVRGYSHFIHFLDNPQLKALQDAGMLAPAHEGEVITEEDLASGDFEQFFGQTEQQQHDDEIPF